MDWTEAIKGVVALVWAIKLLTGLLPKRPIKDKDKDKDMTHTLYRLCREIHDIMMEDLTTEQRNDNRRVYAMTWSIVELHHKGLVTPTEEARARLEDLHSVVTTERDLNTTNPTKE